MGDQIFTSQVPQSVLKFHQLNKQIVLRIQPRSVHWALEIKTQPFLDAAHAASLSEIKKEHEVQDDRSCQNAVSAQEIDLDLHGITEPPIDVDVVPSLLIVSARGIVVDTHLVGEILVQIRVEFRLQNLIQHRQLTFFLRFK